MATHSYHDDLRTHGLADDCRRCDQLADDPFGLLDDQNLGALIDRCEQGEDGRSHNETRAMLTIQHAIDRIRRVRYERAE